MPGVSWAATVMVTDADLRIKAVSGGVPAQTGSRARRGAELVGESLLDHIEGIDREIARQACETILAGKRFTDGALCCRRTVTRQGPEGSGKWIVAMGPVMAGDDTVEGVVCTSFPSREDTALGQCDVGSARFYECLVENVGDIIFVADKQGYITYVNRRVEHYAGVAANRLVGLYFSLIVHPDDTEKCSEAFRRAVTCRVPVVDLHFRVVVPDGSIRYFVVNGGTVGTGDDEMVLGICRDVTESVELHERLLARNRALSALNDIVVALSSPISLDEALQLGLEKILAALDLNTGAVFLRHSDDKMHIRAYKVTSANTVEGRLRLLADEIGELSAAVNNTVIVPDILTEEDFGEDLRAFFVEIGVEAIAAVPLRCGEPITAVLSLALPAPGELTVDQIEFLSLAAGILGPAIDNARLHADLSDRLDRLAMLEHLAKSINAGRDINSVLQSCLRVISNVVHFDIAAIVLVERNGDAKEFIFSDDGAGGTLRNVRLGVEQLERFVGIRGPVVLADAAQVAIYHGGGHVGLGDGSGLCVPFVYKDTGLGLLKMWSSEAAAFGDREVEILEAAAEHLAIAVCNTRLYEVEQGRSLQLEALAKEAQHRIKNNLQMITGLLSMSESNRGSGVRAIGRCLRQVRAIATVHELVNPGNISAMLGLKKCVKKVASNALLATGRARGVRLTVSGEDSPLTADAATALGIIINELVSNAVEHGFKDRQDGRIEVTISREGNMRVVGIADNGVGLPPGFHMQCDSDSVSGLGLVTSLARHGLGGQLEVTGGEEGTLVRITF